MAEKLLKSGVKHDIMDGVIHGTEQYTVLRSARKTMTLSVNAEGKVVVRAPVRISAGQIETFVERHAAWIARRRAELERARPDLSDGGTLSLCGREYRIAAGQRARIAGDVLFLPSRERERAAIALMKRLAREKMGGLLREYADRFGFAFSRLRITSARGRWGSCSTSGTIGFSFRTVLLSEEEMRYLAVHELCHTRHMDHGAAFWRDVGTILPGYEPVRRGLRKKSAVMYFF